MGQKDLFSEKDYYLGMNKEEFESHVDTFFKNNDNLFNEGDAPQVNKGKVVSRLRKELNDSELPVDFYAGKCFAVAKFVYYLLDGYNDPNLILKRTNRQDFAKLKDDSILTAVHWFVSNEHYGDIIDISKTQFIYDFYPNYLDSRRSDYGHRTMNGRWNSDSRYKLDHVAPSHELLRLAEAYEDQFGHSGGFAFYLNLRRQAEEEYDNRGEDYPWCSKKY